MNFPVAGVTVDPFLLAGIGFVVGVLGGFFGVGGTVVGVECGAWIIEGLEAAGSVDLVVGVAYIVILLAIGTFTAWESLRALRMVRTDRIPAHDTLGFQGVARRVHRLTLPPMVSFPASGIASISLWPVVGVGFLTGLLAGTLGVGGGFVRMPLLVFVTGMPTHVAVGTDLFEIVISAGYGTVTHALKGNVDVLMALVMQTGAALGAQIEALSTQYFARPRIRLLFSVLPFLGAAMVAARLVGSVLVPF